MGNSEVGHLNIGAGRLVVQDLPRIDAAIASGEIERVPALTSLIESLRQSGGTCLYRRSRYAATLGRGRHCAPGRGATAIRPDRDSERSLLRYGPRPALGPRGKGLPCDR